MNEGKLKKADPGPARAEPEQDQHRLEALLRNIKLPNSWNHQRGKWWRRKDGSHRIWP